MSGPSPSQREPCGPGAVNVVCPGCSYYFAAEISGRRQRVDCPQCGSFAASRDPEGGLIVKLVCRRCAVGYPVDVASSKSAFVCPWCGAEPKLRDREMLQKLCEVWKLRAAEKREVEQVDVASFVNLDEMEIGAQHTRLMPRSLALAYKCVPIRYENNVLTVAMSDRVQPGVLEDLAFVLRCAVQGTAAPRVSIERALRRCYGSDGGERSA